MEVKCNLERNMVELYPTALCNLNCSYCQIDKNDFLKTIDKMLEDSFLDENYYINRIKTYFPMSHQLTNLELWGGEPFLFVERVFPLLHKIIAEYPYFENIFSSTNFSFPKWNDKFFSLMEVLGQYPNRNFNYTLQLSCDGPEHINDLGRGKGVTKKCLNNLEIFFSMIGEKLPPNVNLTILVKQTLTLDTFKMINSKEKIIEYYKFFETNFFDKIYNLNYNNVTFFPGVPNFAVPSPATKQDGLLFADFCRLCAEIEKEQHFHFYQTITPFISYYYNVKKLLEEEPTYRGCHGTCGAGSRMIGILPNNYVSICNEGFTQIIEEYRKQNQASSHKEATILFSKTYAENRFKLFCTDDEYVKIESNFAKTIAPNSSVFYTNTANMIVMLALVGQIDPKYKDMQEAIRAAKFCCAKNVCIKDNYNMTGSITTFNTGELKLLLNGALDEIIKVLEKNSEQ